MQLFIGFVKETLDLDFSISKKILQINSFSFFLLLFANSLFGNSHVDFIEKINAPRGSVPCSGLFFSEYVESTGDNRMLEIYNPTASTVDLSGYQIQIFEGGNTTASITIDLTGTIASNDVFVIANGAADPAYLALADQTASLGFTGDDAIRLQSAGLTLDVIGEIGFDPGTQWSSNGVTTQNATLRRKNTIQEGDTSGVFDPSLEWNAFSSGDISNIGSFVNLCFGASGLCSGLFISEYAEGSSNNKCIEILNPTLDSVDLSDYKVDIYTNGSSTVSSTISLSGSILAGDVYVICNTGINSALLPSSADRLTGSLNFNGDDAVVLVGPFGILDIIGQPGTDPGTQWSANGVSTNNATIRRKYSIEIGDIDSTNVFDPSLEWDAAPQDDFSDFGMHANTCTMCSLTDAGIDSILCNDNGTISDDTDDYITFHLNPIVDFPSSGTYRVNPNTITPTFAPFGTVTTFSTPIGSAGMGDINYSVEDSLNSDCKFFGVISDPGTCSVGCSITGVNTVVTCNNNGTFADPTDDFLDIDLTVMGQGVAANFILSGAGIDPDTGVYNVNSSYTTALGTAGAGDFNLTITDQVNNTCMSIVRITDPGSCSVNCSQLFFSEYVEGSSNNKCLEIFNPTSNIVDLASEGYTVEIYFNGSTTPSRNIPLTGTIGAGDVYLLCSSSAMMTSLGLADQVSGSVQYNGDDAVSLSKNGVLLDVIGQIGVRPTGGWSNNGVSTMDATIRRLSSIGSGDANGADPFDPSLEWEAFPIDNTDGLTNHASACVTCDLTASGLANIECNDNGTPRDDTDDIITFDIQPEGIGTSTTYSIAGMTPMDTLYNVVQNFASATGTAGMGDLNLSIVDTGEMACVFPFVVADPGTCNSCDLLITNIATQDEICPNANDGMITVTVTSSFPTYEYSIDGTDYSNTTGVFENLAPGMYTVYVREALYNFCADTSITVTVGAGFDNVPPTIQCQNMTYDLPLTGTLTVPITDFITALSDNCSDSVDITLVPPDLTFDCSHAGMMNIPTIIMATDENGQTSDCAILVSINPLPNCTPTIEILDPCTCKNNTTTLQDGQFDETIKVTALSGQTWTITAVSGLYTATSAAPPTAPIPITVGMTLTELPVGSGMYTLEGIHVDSMGYSIVLENGLGDVLDTMNFCSYPTPILDFEDGVYCAGSGTIPFVSMPGDADIAFEEFTINGAPATEFDPVALGPGFYTVTYTVDGGQALAFGADDPGCIQSILRTATVVETPATLVCNGQVQVSLDQNCSSTISPDLIAEGVILCDDDYAVTLTNAQGVSIGNVLSAAHIGNSITATLTHLPSGNSCWGTVTVEDKLAPVMTCTDVTVNCAITNYTPSALAALGLNGFPIIDENCGTVSPNWADIQEIDWSCNDPFSYQVRRKWEAVDNSGNSSSCVQNIFFERITFADILLPSDTMLSCENPTTDPVVTGVPYVLLNGNKIPLYPDAGLCELNVIFGDTPIQVCDGSSKIIRTWTIADWCQPTVAGVNPLLLPQIIMISDTVGPVVSCPADIVVNTNPFDCERDIDLPDVMIEDACSRINSIQAQFTLNGITETLQGSLEDFPGNNLWHSDTLGVVGVANNLPIGLHEMRYRIKDDCGNVDSCVFSVTVVDATPPITICNSHISASLSTAGDIRIPATSFDDGSFDNCGLISLKARRTDFQFCQSAFQFHDGVQFCCDDVGDTIQVVLRVYDQDLPTGSFSTNFLEDRSNECMVEVTISDKIKPTCTAPADVTVACEAFDPSLWAYGEADIYDNCCVDTTIISNNFALFDTICNTGRIIRTFTAMDCGGLMSSCTQAVTVTYNQDYYFQFPDDETVYDCDGTGNYGEPIIYDEDCELMGVSYTDEIITLVPDACYKIERTWKITNWCTHDPNLSCEFVNNPFDSPSGPRLSPFPPNSGHPHEATNIDYFNQYVNQLDSDGNVTANCWTYKQIIKIIDGVAPTGTMTDVECDKTPNDADFYNDIALYDASINSHDLCEGPADLCITATDLCSGSDISAHYLLFLDMDGDGSMETVINSLNAPATSTINIGNAANQNYAGGTPVTFDKRAVPGSRKYRFGTKTTVSGNDVTICLAWKENRFYLTDPAHGLTPELPYGTHKIKWFVTDGCGNELVQEKSFTISDCKKPTVICKNGLSINLMNTNPAMVPLWASDVFEYAEDNCTPQGQIKYAMCFENVNAANEDVCSGSFPLNPDGSPDTLVTFNCAHLGTAIVQVWAIDKAGNSDFCQAFVSVQDNAGACGVTSAQIAGALEADYNAGAYGLELADVDLTGTHPALPPVSLYDLTDTDGAYMFQNVPVNGQYVVTPLKDDDATNGVNAYDLLLIQKHLLGTGPILNPYRLIAADVNKSGSITPTDIIELRKLILGIYPSTLPNNTSWRFVDKSFVFSNPLNPFADNFPEVINIAQLQQNMTDGSFEAIKIGDLDEGATLNASAPADDRTYGQLLFDIKNQSVHAGETFTVEFEADSEFSAFQMTLNLDGLEVVDILPGAGMDLNNFAVFTDKKAITLSSTNEKGKFSIVFKSNLNGSLSEMLHISSRITRALAFGKNAERMDVGLRFNSENQVLLSEVAFEIYQNTPNPFRESTTIGFNMPVQGDASLRIYDDAGRTLFLESSDFGKGFNAFIVNRKELPQSGVFYYEIRTQHDKETKQMILID